MGLFILTFMICCFILLMQFLWMHVNDLVGKGVEVVVLLEFLVYATMSVIPLALPLAILLASLMTFGNLGEKFELTAMKSAGVSLFRIMRPLTVFIGLISIGAFFFSNHVLPASQSKLWALIFSLRQKSPELDIPVAEFYSGINGINIYVGKKNPRTGLMQNMMIYDYSKGFENASVTVADSGRVFFTADNHYLLLRLYSGESFENLDDQQQRTIGTYKNVPYRRETFREKQVLIDFNTELNRYDASVLEDQHVSKNVKQLMASIDSVMVLSQARASEQGAQLIAGSYFGREMVYNRDLGEIAEENQSQYDLNQLKQTLNKDQLLYALSVALDRARAKKDVVDYHAILLEDYNRYIRKHQIELHRKYTLSFACLIFFFIGAPLGAIIRKGGLGAPIVISVVMFIIYYIIDNSGYKMAREGLWPVWQGMWLSSAVLLPIGIFLTYKAATDSGIFNPEVWMKVIERFANRTHKLIERLKSNRTLR